MPCPPLRATAVSRCFVLVVLIAIALHPSGARAEQYLYVDNSSTPCASYPTFQSACYPNLQAAYDAIGGPITEDHHIKVFPGIHTARNDCYTGFLTALCIRPGADDYTSPQYSIVIEPFDPDDPPLFDGEDVATNFVWVRTGPNRATNVHLQGLHVARFHNSALNLGTKGDEGFNGGNRIESCTVYEMGGPDEDPGYGVVLFEDSKNNWVADNLFLNNANENPGNLYHTTYGNFDDCYGNVIEGNTVIGSVGDVFKFRNGAHHNVVRHNYVVSSAYQCYVQYMARPGETWGIGNSVYGNTFVFPHDSADQPSLPIDGTCCHAVGPATCGPWVFTNSDGSSLVGDGDNYVYGASPTSLEVTALASGDFNDGPGAEIVRAQELPSGLTVVDATLAGGDTYYPTHLYSSDAWQVIDFSVGRFDASGSEQLVSAFRAGGDRIYRGDGSSTLTINRLFTGDSGLWAVRAMTSGDYFQDGVDELVVAFESTSGVTKICRGDATIFNGFDPTQSGCGLATLLYSSSTWKVRALSSGDLDEDGVPDVAVAFQNGVNTRVYLLNAATGLLFRKIFDDWSNLTVNSMAVGAFDGQNHDLMTAWRTASGLTEVYRGTGDAFGNVNGNGGVKDLQRIYVSTGWHVTRLWADELRDGGGDEIVTVFQAPLAAPTNIQVWLGDGTTTLTSYHKVYQWTP